MVHPLPKNALLVGITGLILFALLTARKPVPNTGTDAAVPPYFKDDQRGVHTLPSTHSRVALLFCESLPNASIHRPTK